MKTLLKIFFISLIIIGCSNDAGFPEDFDPNRDAQADINKAIEMAKASGKRIILDVGGEWCIWCHRLDDFIKTNKEIDKELHENFIVLKINYSDENKNEEVLSKYPKISGFPHLFVLESDGTVLKSKNTGELEKDKSYSKEKLLEFINKWKKS